jgi:murein L,D-transpeptidase YcbB/YkuD
MENTSKIIKEKEEFMRIGMVAVLLSLVLMFTGCATMKAPVSEKGLKAEVERLEQENEMLAMQRDAYKMNIEQISQETKAKLNDLQSTLSKEKDRTAELKSKIASLSKELESLKGTPLYEERPALITNDFTKKVQIALYAAGFDPGKIDGKMGPQTIQAIKNFQESRGLKADGIVGKETWALLQEYSDMK